MSTETKRTPFFINGISTVAISDWLNWASGEFNTENSWPIVLPMIQRGSVWKPHQVMDLWDTLLRGMPLGSMMASHVEKGGQYFTPIKRELITLSEGGGLSLLDGQQRTLSMLLAWPAIGGSMNQRVWVDIGEDDKNDHIFRFHFTTKNHPFGFQLSGRSGSPVSKLTLSERRQALAAHTCLLVDIDKKSADARQNTLWASGSVFPWHATLPVNLQEILNLVHLKETDFKIEITRLRNKQATLLKEQIEFFKKQDQVEDVWSTLIRRFEKRLNAINTMPDEIFNSRVQRIHGAACQFEKQYMPVIEVSSKILSEENDSGDKDPALAVLFQRVGTGGTALSNADYVYSVIKHHSPECHTLVEKLLGFPRVAALFTPVSLVSTAVRLTAASLNLPDYSQINKNQFGSLLKDRVVYEKASFISEFPKMIAENGSFTTTLNALLDGIAYQPNKVNDIGLPKHALCLLELPMLEVVLYWLQGHDNKLAAAQTNRDRLIRFMLYCALAVHDIPKCSTALIKKLKDTPRSEDFPDNIFIDELVKEGLAYPMRSPAYYENNTFLKQMIFTPIEVTGLRGWPRFSIDLNQNDRTEAESFAIQLYRRFWNRNNRYTHTILLWLQREYIYNEFEAIPVLPGSEDETPYDFDHICPQSHWAYWTGSSTQEGSRIIDFCGNDAKDKNSNKGAESLLGNSIGNVRVWSNIDNRSDGDAPPAIKLKPKSRLNDVISEANREQQLLRDCAISEDEKPDWVACSSAQDHRKWTRERSLAFQRVIERRAFNLFKRFYDELGFTENA